MFKTVKARLTLLFTGSLIIILVLFITVLYLTISAAFRNEQIAELNAFFENEEHEIMEEFYEGHREHIDYKSEGDIFYYVFDLEYRLLEGEETVRGFYQYVKKENLQKTVVNADIEVQWGASHFLIVNFPIDDIGSVLIGMDITGDSHVIQRIIWILVLLTIVFSILFAVMGHFFAGQSIKPIQQSFLTQRKFVSDASHELRTPLSVFYSSIDVLVREERDHLSPFGQEILEDLSNESELMNKLLNDLLFLARNDQENFELELEKFNLSILMHTLNNRFSRILPDHLILKSQIQDEIYMIGDKIRIQQLLYILLDNASRYTDQGSITCTLMKKDQKIVLTVEDTGVGISADKLPHIFDRFYRADSARTTEGSGLGLSIAKTIIEAHKGDISVKSEVGKGTIFIITFQDK